MVTTVAAAIAAASVEFSEVWIFEERESVETTVDVLLICLPNSTIISEGGQEKRKMRRWSTSAA